MSTGELEKRLADAKESLNRILKGPFKLEASLAAFSAVAQAQRDLAASKGEPYAVPREIGFHPEAAVPAPFLLENELRTILMFRAVKKEATGKLGSAGWGVVECIRCKVSQFGYPNDETLPGHPLSESGLEACGVYEVANSAWIKK